MLRRTIASSSSRRGSLAVFASADSTSNPSRKHDERAATPSRRTALILSGAWAIGLAKTRPASAEEATSTSTSSSAVVQRAPVAPLTAREKDAVAAYESASPSVVNVFDLTLLRSGGGAAFGSGSAEPEGNGSGVLWRDGVSGNLVVVTNYHVLATSLDRIKERQIGGGASNPGPTVARIVAATPDGTRRALDAAVIGVDASHDVAVLTLLGGASASVGNDDFFSRLRPIERAESAKNLKIGQQVFAIGNPFGFSLSMSGGVVSGLNRSFESKVARRASSSAPSASDGTTAGNTINGAILHSAPQNPGSSGGAVVDSKGRLVGLSTAIFTDTGSNVGLSFALPVDLLERVVPQLVARGSARFYGAGVSLATPAVSAALLPTASTSSIPPGVMISSVAAGSGAEKAGLLPVRRTLSGIAAGDVVVSVGGRACADAGAFSSALEEISSSSSSSTIEVEFDVVRGVGTGQQKREKVKVVLAPE